MSDKKPDPETELSYVRLRNTITKIRHKTGRPSMRKNRGGSRKGAPYLGYSNNSVFIADDSHPVMYKKK